MKDNTQSYEDNNNAYTKYMLNKISDALTSSPSMIMALHFFRTREKITEEEFCHYGDAISAIQSLSAINKATKKNICVLLIGFTSGPSSTAFFLALLNKMGMVEVDFSKDNPFTFKQVLPEEFMCKEKAEAFVNHVASIDASATRAVAMFDSKSNDISTIYSHLTA